MATMDAGAAYMGDDTTVEICFSSKAEELAIYDRIGHRRPCAAHVPAERRRELAAALTRMADIVERSEYSEMPTKVPAEDGSRIDVAALPPAVAVYVFTPRALASRSIRLPPVEARRLAEDLRGSPPAE